MKKYFLLFALAVCVVACAEKISTNTQTTTQTTTVVTASAEEIAQGKLLVETYCAKCHKVPLPSEHSQAKWDNILQPMYAKAKITDEAQQKLIHDYVYSNLAGGFIH